MKISPLTVLFLAGTTSAALETRLAFEGVTFKVVVVVKEETNPHQTEAMEATKMKGLVARVQPRVT
jgi:hypothetical protein